MIGDHVVIVGGGLAGLSAACYARASGFRTTIIEHNLALGGVCTAWQRDEYLIDGCIRWLTGGPFMAVYNELGITKQLKLRTIERLETIRDVRDNTEISINSDLLALQAQLLQIAPEDRAEIVRLISAANKLTDLPLPLEKPQDLYTLRDGMRLFWQHRHEVGDLMHFRQNISEYTSKHIRSASLQRLLGCVLDPDVPVLFLLFVLGYLARGWLSRPVGGSAAFRDALIKTYESLGGATELNATVEEIIVENGHARGVRMYNGTMIKADAVISTASVPETVLRLLGGRYHGEQTRDRMARWKLFAPVVLATYGVTIPLDNEPQLLCLDGIKPLDIGGCRDTRLRLRIFNDDASFAPAGHTIIQASLPTDYEWWAKRGTCYSNEKDVVGYTILETIDKHIPGVKAACRMMDVATPITYWNMARSWRGSYEGWMPQGENGIPHIPQTLEGLRDLYLAGQWVEPGGGVPTSCVSGRQAVQLLCGDKKVDFVTPHQNVLRRVPLPLWSVLSNQHNEPLDNQRVGINVTL